MEQEILRKLEEQSNQIAIMTKSVEKMRRYFLWTLVISLLVIVLPAIGLIVAIPQFLNVYSAQNLQGL
ncbi:MAG: hypothetical protein HY220_03670 [Candidatus Sungbacteria bacterium]|uniref:Uncharacterized protein n=1 Tax=Candidatus Sungiibacteriota bacterium TaxID=2750080 RepID=A0A9D6LNP4_9BACT|nr:hypothetical protein [Candidatus Sungbacteria bacterium]